MPYHDPDDWMDRAADDYNDWLVENYTALEIEEGDVRGFQKWLDDRLNEVPNYIDEDSYQEETYA